MKVLIITKQCIILLLDMLWRICNGEINQQYN